ncbi:MAG TPA: glycosyltransferase family 39 protein [Solirubrobacterales bacterium]|jgi:4-amino-4-deoxy-L-arabinose transferase-like glycosyltransferase|nr:glycosyltransferase family 39 protein [Solirubrobacterales bacterium]
MEAATLDRGGPAAYAQVIREAARARSRTFWIVAGLTVLAAVLRFATLGVQAYHHDEIVTASRILRGGFGHAMDAVGFSESAPPLYYALAWIWTQLTGTGEFGLRSLSALAGVATVPVAYLIGLELRGRRTGLMAAALVAVNPMLLWYSQEARAYALLALLCAVSLLYCVRALRRGRRRDFVLWGIASGLALATHYFAGFAIAAEVILLLHRRGRESLAGLWIIGLAGLLLAPLAIHQMSLDHAEWIGNFTLGHRLWETAATFVSGETTDIIARPERPILAVLPLALGLAALALLAFRGNREGRRAGAIPLSLSLAAIGIPLLIAVTSPSKDFVLARNVLPALVPLLIAIAIGVTLPAARRLGAAIGAALLVYSLGFCVWVSFSPDLQRPDWDVVAATVGEPEAPRATVTWVLGEASLRYYLSSGAIQVTPADGYDWLVHEVDFVSDGRTAPPPARLLGPGFRETWRQDAGRLYVRHFELPGPGLAPLRLRELRQADLDFRNTGVLLDGIGPG